MILTSGCNKPDGGNSYKRQWSGREIFDTWTFEHQDTSTVRSIWMEEDTLCIATRGNTMDRTKLHTDNLFTTGEYTWKTYIPEFAPGDKTSVGSWIYCDDHHEIDFEVGWGKPEDRLKYNCKDGEVLAFMTNQDYPFTSTAVPVTPGWHIFSINLQEVKGNYDVTWSIDGSEKKKITVGFGPETAFRIYVSVENLHFIGTDMPLQDNVGRYEWVKFKGRITDKNENL